MNDTIELGMKVVSTNKLYSGKRYKTKQARDFENYIRLLLAKKCGNIRIPESGDLELVTRIYVSRKFDTSNCLKLLEDCIAKHFKINDRRFAGHRISREVVKEGEEKIRFKINLYNSDEYEI